MPPLPPMKLLFGAPSVANAPRVVIGREADSWRFWKARRADGSP